ncbi:hypothetical protein AGMMS49960_16990 [Betaproteobacteria bacterium]|nr:hypothetical protein AGMMS49960_16990 [Betaproteobacteria bacterium]GHU16247.1 hypothetical protein AGMMS50243_01910 [Betaproteobacteria bacterium]
MLQSGLSLAQIDAGNGARGKPQRLGFAAEFCGQRLDVHFYFHFILAAMIDFIHSPDDNEPALNAQLADEAATLALGAKLAAVLEPTLKIWLSGDLGSGKTTLTRGVLRALGHQGPVKSPTYSLIEPYVVSRLHLYHFDFYRMNFPEEFLDAGLEEYFSGTGVCIVEWPQQAAPYLAAPDLLVALAAHEDGRQARITAKTETGQRCIDRLTGNTTPPQTAPQA